MPQTYYHGSTIPEIRILEPRSLFHGGIPSAKQDKEQVSPSEKVLYLTTSIPYALVYLWDSEKYEVNSGEILPMPHREQMYYSRQPQEESEESRFMQRYFSQAWSVAESLTENSAETLVGEPM